jgi:hypothetical protein
VLKGRPGLWLELLKEPLSSGGILTLLDSRIAKADVEAGKAAYQANNPPPKF